MTISDAIPVQFWTADKETFNEKQLCIPKNECFCAPWNCDDEIIIQFQDTAAQNMELSIIDGEGQVLYILEFDEIETGIYQLSIIPSELSPELCSKQVQFKIHGASVSVLDDQVADITGWSNSGTGDKPWIVPSYQLESNNFIGEFVGSPLGVENGQSYEMLVDIDAGHSNKHLYVTLSKSSGSGTQTIDMGSSLTSGVNSEFFTADDDYDQIELFVESTDAVQLRISEVTVREFDINVSGGEVFTLTNKAFVGTLSPWTNVDNSGGLPWTHDVPFSSPFPNAALAGGSSVSQSDFLQQVLSSPIPSGTEVTVSVTCEVNNAQNNISLVVSFWDGATNQVIDTILVPDDSNPHVIVFEGTLSITATHIRISTVHSPSPHIWSIYLYEVSDISTDLVIGTTLSISPFNEWVNVDNNWYDWSVDSGDAVVLPGSSNSLKVFFTREEDSRVLSKSVSLSEGDIMDYSVQLSSQGAAVARQVTATVEFLLAGEVVLSLDYTLSGSTSSLTQTIADEIVLPDDVDEIRVYGTSGTDIFQSLEVTNFIIDAAEILLKSDCLDIKESHACTEVIEYSNNVDFDGIVYDTSPVPVFKLRIPALFYKEDNPMEQEDLDLSNGEIVTLRQSIQEKRLLEVGYMPNYMHKKIQKILMHKTVTIDGQQWKRRDPYEAENIDKYALKTGECWLTLYNSVERNTL